MPYDVNGPVWPPVPPPQYQVPRYQVPQYQVPPWPSAWRPAGYPYKGARLGLPAVGPGSLASQWRRLAARLLDALFLIPVWFTMGVVFGLYALSHSQFRISPVEAHPQFTTFAPALHVLVAQMLLGLISALVGFLYEASCTQRWGRTPGKAVVGIRAVRVVGGLARPAPLSAGTSWARAACFWLVPLVPWLGGLTQLLNELWCLWDQDRQCLHDKVVQTVVVNTR